MPYNIYNTLYSHVIYGIHLNCFEQFYSELRALVTLIKIFFAIFLRYQNIHFQSVKYYLLIRIYFKVFSFATNILGKILNVITLNEYKAYIYLFLIRLSLFRYNYVTRNGSKFEVYHHWPYIFVIQR